VVLQYLQHKNFEQHYKINIVDIEGYIFFFFQGILKAHLSVCHQAVCGLTSNMLFLLSFSVKHPMDLH